MSLLLANGHLAASQYPLGMLEDEVSLVIDRQRGYWGTGGTIVQAAAASVMSKKGATAFTKLMKLIVGE